MTNPIEHISRYGWILFLLVLYILVPPVSCQTCDAVVPLAIIVVVLAMLSCGLLVTLIWAYTKTQRRRASGRSRTVSHQPRPTRVTETETFFTNLGMSESATSLPSRAQAPSTSHPYPQRGPSPVESQPTMSGYGARAHGPRGVHDPPKYVPGTSRHTSTYSGYSSRY